MIFVTYKAVHQVRQAKTVSGFDSELFNFSSMSFIDWRPLFELLNEWYEARLFFRPEQNELICFGLITMTQLLFRRSVKQERRN